MKQAPSQEYILQEEYRQYHLQILREAFRGMDDLAHVRVMTEKELRHYLERRLQEMTR